MGDSSPPRLRAPTPGAVALSPAVRATPIPPLRLPPRIVTVRPPPFRRDSSRTHRHALPLVKQLFASVAQTMMVGWAHAAICDVYIFEREGRGPLRCIAVQGFAPYTSPPTRARLSCSNIPTTGLLARFAGFISTTSILCARIEGTRT